MNPGAISVYVILQIFDEKICPFAGSYPLISQHFWSCWMRILCTDYFCTYLPRKQVALAIRGLASRGFDYSHQIYAELNPRFI